MPKQNGIFKFKGTLDGICYYQLNGQYVQRKAVGPSRERINTDPAFKNVKSNNQEFAAASQLSKAIRLGLGDTGRAFQDNYMASRLTGRCRKVIQKGSGALGQREANLLNHPKAIIGFQLNKEAPFKQLYTAKSVVTTNPNQTQIAIQIPKSNSNHHNQIPKNATHFKLTAALSSVSNMVFQYDVNQYITIRKNLHKSGTITESQSLLCQIEHQDINLQLQVPTNSNTPETITHTVWLGITYLVHQNNSFHELKTAQAMECMTLIPANAQIPANAGISS